MKKALLSANLNFDMLGSPNLARPVKTDQPRDTFSTQLGMPPLDAALMDGNGPKGRTRSAKAKRKFGAKAKRAAKRRQFKGGQRIR